jgi:hypothetical protein
VPVFLLTSLLCCGLVLQVSPKTAFFLLPFRAWEFLAGFGLKSLPAFVGHIRVSRLARMTFWGVLALGAILFFALPINGDAPNVLRGHPGLAAIFMVGITSCFIYFNFSPPTTWLFRFVEQLGTYSYSIYLVHFPILVFLRYQPFMGTVLGPFDWSKGVLSLVLLISVSYLFFTYIEQRSRISPKQIRVFVLCSLIAAFSIPLLTKLQIHNYSGFKQNISSAYTDRSEYRCGKLWRIQHPLSKMCPIGYPNNEVKILLLGNSYADSLKKVFARVANENKASAYFWVQNTPLMSSDIEINDVENEIRSKGISSALLHYSSGAVSPVILQKFVSRMAESGIPVVILGPLPTWEVKVPEAMWDLTEQNLSHLTQSYSQYLSRNAEEIKSLKSLIAPGVSYVDLGSVFCQTKCLYADTGGTPYYWDSGHLTLSGANLLSKTLNDSISKLIESTNTR